MANGNDNEDSNAWLAVIGRSLAFLCFTQSELRDKDLATQGRFLEALGVSRKEAAGLLGTTYGSLSEMISRTAKGKKKKIGGKRGSKKKT